MTIGITALAIAEQALGDTLACCKERNAFGQPIETFQHSRFLLAEMTTDEAAMVKWWDTELYNRVTDPCLQLHSGYGYMREYVVGRAQTDGRVQSIFGGTTEIMEEIIGRGLGL